jgi:hypothetical protein
MKILSALKFYLKLSSLPRKLAVLMITNFWVKDYKTFQIIHQVYFFLVIKSPQHARIIN